MSGTIKRHESKPHLSAVVEGGGLVFTAGVTAKDRDKDIGEQTREVLAEIDRLLALAGSHKSKILSATIWVSEIAHRGAMNEVWIAWADPNNLPARACVEAKLADPRTL